MISQVLLRCLSRVAKSLPQEKFRAFIALLGFVIDTFSAAAYI
jgi:hypothetical protein